MTKKPALPEALVTSIREKAREICASHGIDRSSSRFVRTQGFENYFKAVEAGALLTVEATKTGCIRGRYACDMEIDALTAEVKRLTAVLSKLAKDQSPPWDNLDWKRIAADAIRENL